MKEQASAKNVGGRPTKYTDDVAVEICSRIASGQTLLEICRDDHLPSEFTVRGWDLADRAGLAEGKPYKGFSTMYARARVMQIEHEVDEMRVIADTPFEGVVVTDKQHVNKDGDVIDLTESRKGDMVEHRRLQIETRKWRAGKIAWRDYGARLGQDTESDEDQDTKVIIEGGLPSA